jgi:hypothetical protein
VKNDLLASKSINHSKSPALAIDINSNESLNALPTPFQASKIRKPHHMALFPLNTRSLNKHQHPGPPSLTSQTLAAAACT